jgi:hypothetical protein
MSAIYRQPFDKRKITEAANVSALYHESAMALPRRAVLL